MKSFIKISGADQKILNIESLKISEYDASLNKEFKSTVDKIKKELASYKALRNNASKLLRETHELKAVSDGLKHQTTQSETIPISRAMNHYSEKRKNIDSKLLSLHHHILAELKHYHYLMKCGSIDDPVGTMNSIIRHEMTTIALLGGKVNDLVTTIQYESDFLKKSKELMSKSYSLYSPMLDGDISVTNTLLYNKTLSTNKSYRKKRQQLYQVWNQLNVSSKLEPYNTHDIYNNSNMMMSARDITIRTECNTNKTEDPLNITLADSTYTIQSPQHILIPTTNHLDSWKHIEQYTQLFPSLPCTSAELEEYIYPTRSPWKDYSSPIDDILQTNIPSLKFPTVPMVAKQLSMPVQSTSSTLPSAPNKLTSTPYNTKTLPGTVLSSSNDKVNNTQVLSPLRATSTLTSYKATHNTDSTTAGSATINSNASASNTTNSTTTSLTPGLLNIKSKSSSEGQSTLQPSASLFAQSTATSTVSATTATNSTSAITPIEIKNTSLPTSLTGTTTTTPSATSSLTVDEIRHKIHTIYQHHNPSKLSEINHLLEKNKGKEMELLYRIEKKYNVPSTSAVTQSTPLSSGTTGVSPVVSGTNNTSSTTTSLFGQSGSKPNTSMNATPFLSNVASNSPFNPTATTTTTTQPSTSLFQSTPSSDQNNVNPNLMTPTKTSTNTIFSTPFASNTSITANSTATSSTSLFGNSSNPTTSSSLFGGGSSSNITNPAITTSTPTPFSSAVTPSPFSARGNMNTPTPFSTTSISQQQQQPSMGLPQSSPFAMNTLTMTGLSNTTSNISTNTMNNTATAPTSSLFGTSTTPSNQNMGMMSSMGSMFNSISSTTPTTTPTNTTNSLFGGGSSQKTSISTNIQNIQSTSSNQQFSIPEITLKLRQLYSKYDPTKLEKIPHFLEKYRGREMELLLSVEKKYLPNTAAMTNINNNINMNNNMGINNNNNNNNTMNNNNNNNTMFGNTSSFLSNPMSNMMSNNNTTPGTANMGFGGNMINSSPFHTMSPTAASTGFQTVTRSHSGSAAGNSLFGNTNNNTTTNNNSLNISSSHSGSFSMSNQLTLSPSNFGQSSNGFGQSPSNFGQSSQTFGQTSGWGNNLQTGSMFKNNTNTTNAVTPSITPTNTAFGRTSTLGSW